MPSLVRPRAKLSAPVSRRSRAVGGAHTVAKFVCRPARLKPLICTSAGITPLLRTGRDVIDIQIAAPYRQPDVTNAPTTNLYSGRYCSNAPTKPILRQTSRSATRLSNTTNHIRNRSEINCSAAFEIQVHGCGIIRPTGQQKSYTERYDYAGDLSQTLTVHADENDRKGILKDKNTNASIESGGRTNGTDEDLNEDKPNKRPVRHKDFNPKEEYAKIKHKLQDAMGTLGRSHPTIALTIDERVKLISLVKAAVKNEEKNKEKALRQEKQHASSTSAKKEENQASSSKEDITGKTYAPLRNEQQHASANPSKTEEKPYAPGSHQDPETKQRTLMDSDPNIPATDFDQYKFQLRCIRGAFCEPSVVTRPGFFTEDMMDADIEREGNNMKTFAKDLKLSGSLHSSTAVKSIIQFDNEITCLPNTIPINAVPSSSLRVQWRLTHHGQSPSMQMVFILLNRYGPVMSLVRISANSACAVFKKMSCAECVLTYLMPKDRPRLLIGTWWYAKCISQSFRHNYKTMLNEDQAVEWLNRVRFAGPARNIHNKVTPADTRQIHARFSVIQDFDHAKYTPSELETIASEKRRRSTMSTKKQLATTVHFMKHLSGRIASTTDTNRLQSTDMFDHLNELRLNADGPADVGTLECDTEA